MRVLPMYSMKACALGTKNVASLGFEEVGVRNQVAGLGFERAGVRTQVAGPDAFSNVRLANKVRRESWAQRALAQV